MINFKITDLYSSPSLNVNRDFLMISRQNENGIYTSYKIKPSELIGSFEDKFENQENAHVAGTWTFTSFNGLFVSDLNPSLSGLNSVINMKYAYNTFMEKLNALSSEIWDGSHIPSHVDEIIYSTTLKTLEKVQKVYGTNTQWEQIQGRFLMASTSNIGKLAGAVTEKLTIDNVPAHGHDIKMNDSSKTISMNELKEYDGGQIAKASELDAQEMMNRREKLAIALWGNRSFTDGDFGILGDIDEGEKPEYGNRASRTIALNGSCTITENSGGNEGHNNIPPFYSVYIWRRIR